MLFRDLFNTAEGVHKSITVNLLQSAIHDFLHGDVFLYGMYDLTFSPYTLSEFDEFVTLGSSIRVTIRVRRSGITMRSPKSRFILMSTNEYNTSKLSSMDDTYLSTINNSKITLPIIKSSVVFNNLQFLDDANMLELDGTTMFQVVSKEQSKSITFTNNNFKIYGTLMKSVNPINITVENTKFYDYYNMDAGFVFDTKCTSVDNLQAEIVFDQIAFESMDPDIGKLKTSGFIVSSAPANFTVKNSLLNVHHDYIEDVNVIHFEDTGS